MTTVVYEQPLNERMRTFLRLETLLNRQAFYQSSDIDWCSYSAILNLLEMGTLLERGDLKSEMMKELERQHINLSNLAGNERIDSSRLQNTLEQQKSTIDSIHGLNGKIGEHLKGSDFLLSIKQRSSIPGGTCDFDIPELHHWLHKPFVERKKNLDFWADPFMKLLPVIEQIMNLIRDSGVPREVIAENGFFQENLDSQQPNQLLRVEIPDHPEAFPEISAGKHRYTIRLLQQPDPCGTPRQIQADIKFHLARCAV